MPAFDSAPNSPRLASEWLDAIAEQGQVKVFPPKTIIIHEGDSGDALYLIKEGRGKIYSTNEVGKEIVYAMYGPNDMLGEPALDGGVRSASVMTLEKTTCSVIRANEFKQLVAANPALALHVIFKLIRLLRASTEHVKSLALEDVYGRVVRLLMKSAVPLEEKWIVRERLTQQNIADRVGSSREMVSRIFKDLELGNYISVDRNEILIHRKPPPGW